MVARAAATCSGLEILEPADVGFGCLGIQHVRQQVVNGNPRPDNLWAATAVLNQVGCHFRFSLSLLPASGIIKMDGRTGKFGRLGGRVFVSPRQGDQAMNKRSLSTLGLIFCLLAACLYLAAVIIRDAPKPTQVAPPEVRVVPVSRPVEKMINDYLDFTGRTNTVDAGDPMSASFDLDEPSLLRIRGAIKAGTNKQPKDGLIPVYLGLENEDGYPHRGSANVVDNQLNPTTGRISVRAVFPNPKQPGGSRRLSPGVVVRIRLQIGDPHPALLVIDQAVGSDQGLNYVFVVDEENNVQYRRVTAGPMHENLRVISQGLKPDEWVVVGAVQQVRPGMPMRLEKMDMLDPRTGVEAPPAK